MKCLDNVHEEGNWVLQVGDRVEEEEEDMDIKQNID